MMILVTIFGCLLGVVLYKVLCLCTPIDHFGLYSTGLLIACCSIMCSVVGQVPVWYGRIGKK